MILSQTVLQIKSIHMIDTCISKCLEKKKKKTITTPKEVDDFYTDKIVEIPFDGPSDMEMKIQ